MRSKAEGSGAIFRYRLCLTTSLRAKRQSHKVQKLRRFGIIAFDTKRISESRDGSATSWLARRKRRNAARRLVPPQFFRKGFLRIALAARTCPGSGQGANRPGFGTVIQISRHPPTTIILAWRFVSFCFDFYFSPGGLTPATSRERLALTTLCADWICTPDWSADSW